MSDEEFGHEGIAFSVTHSKDGERATGWIDTWGAGPFLIEVAGESWRFEDSDRFGPIFIKKNGDPLASQYLAERSPFWRAHRLWRRQGRPMHEDGITCCWEEPKPMFVQRFNKRTCLVVENGEEDGIICCASCRKRIKDCHCV